jgi:hypothetical protein
MAIMPDSLNPRPNPPQPLASCWARVPFERDQGRVLLACQKHDTVMPPDTVAKVNEVSRDKH